MVFLPQPIIAVVQWCRPLAILFAVGLVFVAQLFVPPLADAATQRVLLQLSNLRQWVDIGANYVGTDVDSQSGNSTSQKIGFSERYTFGIDYAILNQKLANGSLELSAGTVQDFSHGDGEDSQSSAGYTLEYDAELFLLEKSSTPLSLFSNMREELLAQPFSDSYYLTRTNFTGNLTLRNDYVPTNLSYNRTTLETDGQDIDRKQTNDRFLINSNMSLTDFSQTSFSAMTNSGETKVEGGRPGTDVENYQLTGRNTLSWDVRSRRNTLTSYYRFREESGSSELETVSWGETLDMNFGKALTSVLLYNYDKITTAESFNRSQRKSAWVQHKLYDSLVSRADYTTRESDLVSGNQESWDAYGRIDYNKKLPRQSLLSLTYGYSYGENDNDVQEEDLTVIGEPLIVTLAGNFLENRDVDEVTIQVFSSDRLILYVEGVDYDVEVIGRLTRLEFFNPGLSGLIGLGDTLSIDYEHKIDGSIEYSTTGHYVRSSISFLKRRYRLFANYTVTDQSLISGEPLTTSFGKTTTIGFGFDNDFQTHLFGSSYLYVSSPDDDKKTFEAYWQYNNVFGAENLLIRLDEKYLRVEQKQSLALDEDVSSETNLLSLVADYSKKYGQNYKIRYRGRFTDLRGDRDTRNELELETYGEYRWYKFSAFIRARVTWQFIDSNTRRNDYLNLTVRRFF